MPGFSLSEKIAFVNNDMDIYEPVFVTLTSFWRKLSIGGIISIGKINNPELVGKTHAFNEFLAGLEKDEYLVDSLKLKEFGTLKLIDHIFITKLK